MLLGGQTHGITDGHRDAAGLVLEFHSGRGEVQGDGAFVIGAAFAKDLDALRTALGTA
ncbi:hypothetical protein ABZ434_29640 [Streptomyces sp. NPDC005761]|uniref:hypothetical protein n=1 Tax=unclassified Streptomyces TaxID=2593676 RepID=UPI00340A97C2